MQCAGFDPIVAAEPKVLILGTMPSVVSLQAEFYYAHPRNAFWPIMADYFQLPVATLQQKRALIEQSRLALWDVLQACERSGSLDAAIRQPVANVFGDLFEQYPSLNTVLLNGKAAEKHFKQAVLPNQLLPASLRVQALPSTSPANARMPFETKKQIWHQALNEVFKTKL